MREVAVAWIRKGDRCFLQRRDPAVRHLPGLWELPGGGVEAGENLEAALLRELAEPMGIAVTALEPVTWKGETVSSSRIRRCLLEGDTELAGELLGTPYAVCGKAVRRGEELYLRLPPEMALPAEGCYHGLDKTHGGRPVLLTVREGAIAWRGEATEQEPVELAFLGRG